MAYVDPPKSTDTRKAMRNSEEQHELKQGTVVLYYVVTQIDINMRPT
jgi:hypothetical protein